MTLTIGFDLSQTGKNKSGCGYFAQSLIQEIAHLDKKNQYIQYRTFGDFYWDDEFNKIKGIKQSNFRWGKHHQALDEAKFFWSKPFENIETELGEPDILHVNNFFCPEHLYSKTESQKTKLIYTLYDLSFVEHPEWTTEQNRVLCFDNMFNASFQAAHMIAISEYSKKNFLEIFPHYSDEKITVVPLASRYQYDSSLAQPESLPNLVSNEFWLSVGTIEPRKNHLLLLQAYANLKKERNILGEKMFPLILVGGMGWMMSDFETLLVDLDLKEDVIWLGYTDEKSLQWLYQNCYCFIYPSLFEGFGLPVLEAMSCKAPIIASNTSSIPEITGNEAALLIDPTRIESLIETMRACIENKINLIELSQKGLKQSQYFSWKKSAETILNVYKSFA